MNNYIGINNKKGFTLVELLVVIAILGIIGTSIVGVMGVEQKVSASVYKQSDIKSVAMILMDGIEQKLSKSNKITLTDVIDPINEDEQQLYSDQGSQQLVIIKNNGGSIESQQLFSNDFYNGLTVDIQFQIINETNLLQINIALFDQGNLAYDMTDTIKLLNCGKMSQATGDIVVFTIGPILDQNSDCGTDGDKEEVIPPQPNNGKCEDCLKKAELMWDSKTKKWKCKPCKNKGKDNIAYMSFPKII